MSDIEYLAIKDFDGKLVENEGSKTTTGDLVTLTASAGKDMYLAGASLSWLKNLNTGGGEIKVELKIGPSGSEVVKETYIDFGFSSNPDYNPYHFNVRGMKVAATQIIKLEVITIGTGTTIEGNILCFEETTGETPAI